MDEVHRLSACLRCKGVGKEAAIRLGKKLSDKYRTDAEKYDKNGNYKQELFHKGLGRAETKSEVRQVSKVVAEWADGDSVAAHYGFGIDLFCTEDFGRSSDEPSVLDEMHRLWLKSDFGINFVTLCDLAQMLTK
ncbi:hypothetical protein HLH33_00465 [Gluconacetobacter diazotrophicus]|uniref:Uncharacterized protein n=2 Tax=Gluconacetobacter diazotrophicus TaxID=33996 RepID=A0A7W4FBN3_GLUDI|nr:hypothetical protein [Gluconacetobacter diazotrophicus]